jgi:hypothetical protein
VPELTYISRLQLRQTLNKISHTLVQVSLLSRVLLSIAGQLLSNNWGGAPSSQCRLQLLRGCAGAALHLASSLSNTRHLGSSLLCLAPGVVVIWGIFRALNYFPPDNIYGSPLSASSTRSNDTIVRTTKLCGTGFRSCTVGALINVFCSGWELIARPGSVLQKKN